MVRIAVAQIDPSFADPAANLGRIERLTARSAEQGARLAVFPECAVSGYVYRSLEEALRAAEPIPGRSADRLCELAAAHDMYIIAGMLERVGDRVFNAAVVAGPAGLESVYRKTHTLCLGVDRFTTPGDVPYRVVNLPFARVGVLICYDLRFPEPARILALAGAQIVALPTNWPQSSTIQPDVFTRARAAENRVFVLAADRCGRENGAKFLGRSQVVSPSGTVLTEAPVDGETLLIQDIDIAEADVKHVVMQAGEHEMDCFADRREDLYGAALTLSR